MDAGKRSEERRDGKKGRYWRDWSSDVCSSDLWTTQWGLARDERAERGTPAERRKAVLGRILAFAAGLPPAVPPGNHAALADALNGAGIRTATGRKWTPE